MPETMQLDHRLWARLEKILTGLTDAPVDESELDQLTRRIMKRIGIQGSKNLVAGRFDELGYRALNRMLFPPVSHVELMVTENCNLACDYCFVRKKRACAKMSIGTALEAVDFLESHSYEIDTASITFAGGEPTLELPLVRTVVDYTRRHPGLSGKTIKMSLTTNGLLLGERSLSWMKENDLMVLLSLDGTPDVHNFHRKDQEGRGSFERSCHKISLIKRIHGSVNVRMTITAGQACKLSNNIIYLHGIGADRVVIGVASETDWTPDSILHFSNELEKTARYVESLRSIGCDFTVSFLQHEGAQTGNPENEPERGCRAGRSSVTVATDGAIYPCSRFTDIAGGDDSSPFNLGNVKTGFSGNRNRCIFNTLESELEQGCGDCGIKEFCAGGCPAVNLDLTGNRTKCVPLICGINKACESVFRRYGKILTGE